MQLKKCLLISIIGLSVLFAGTVISCSNSTGGGSGNSNQSSEVKDSNTSTDPVNPGDKTDSSNTDDPGTSADPVTPVNPKDPENPDNPVKPENPDNPENPTEITPDSDSESNLDISVDVENQYTNLKFSCKKEGTKYTFTADEGYAEYQWIVNNYLILQSSTTNIFVFDTSKSTVSANGQSLPKAGKYQVTLLVLDSDHKYVGAKNYTIK